MLESFIFISGYILGMQLSRQILYHSFILKKVRRLLIPSIVFSVLYFFCFYQYEGLWSFFYSILNGCGHLWYLPMSFWCFLGGLALYSLKMSEKGKPFICLGLSVCSGLMSFLPFRIGNSCYYLLFFYLGMYMYQKRERIIARIKFHHVILLCLLYIIAYISLGSCKEWLSGLCLSSFLMKVFREIGLKLCVVSYSCLGLLFFYSAVNFFLKRQIRWQCPRWLFFINSLCFGIYVYQQFILKYLYYGTSLPLLTGTYWLPWVGCLVTIILSVACASLTVKTKVGKYLIG